MSTSKARRWANIGVSIVVVAAFALVTGVPSEAAVANALDYAQCANGQPPSTSKACPDGWINGVLQASNSHYREDEVTPQRLLARFGQAGTHSITLRWQVRKGAVHAYDSLATWNYTQNSLTDANRCDGLTGTLCADTGGTSKTPVSVDIPDDPTSVFIDVDSSTDKSPTAGHMISAGAGRQFKIFGDVSSSGTSVSYGTPDGNDSAGDEYHNLTLSFETLSNNAKVQILFGGHVAAPTGSRGWAPGLGASSINGGPYHIKWEAADGASVGNRDNQLMGSAILPFFSGNLTTQASPTSAYVGTTPTLGDTATYVVAAGGSPTNSAGVTFTLRGPVTAADPTNGPTQAECTAATQVYSGTATFAQKLDSNNQPIANTFVASVSTTPSSGLAAGDYYWIVSYAGDGGQNLPAGPHGCGVSSEKVAVAKANPTGSTAMSLKDTFTVSGVTGAVAPTGTVNFKLYRSSDCLSNLVYDSSDANLDGTADTTDPSLSSGTANSGVVSVATAGTYNWVATYSGDTNNNGYTTGCGTNGSEQAVVSY